MNRFASVKFTLWAVIFFSASVFAGSIYQMVSQDKWDGFPNKKYAKEWKTVDSLDELRLSQKALDQVMRIYTLAKTDKNNPQIVKTLIYKFKFSQELQEDTDQDFVKDLDKEIASADPVLTSILYSLKAEVIWTYYQHNRWAINQRTTVLGQSDDMAAWDAARFMDESRENYMLSLQNSIELKKIPINTIEDILIVDETMRPARPTLYDFLAHRAISHFINSETNLNKPSYVFELDDSAYFSSYDKFIKLQPKTQDSLSSDLFAFRLFQDILSFHADTKNALALLDADLKRLEYVYNNYVGLDKEKHYLSALKNLNERFKNKPESPLALFALANYYHSQSFTYKLSDGETDSKYYKKKAVDLYGNLIDKYPKSWLVPQATGFVNSIRLPIISFQAENVYKPNVDNLIRLQFNNVSKVYFKIVPVDYEQYLSKNGDYVEFKKWLNTLAIQKSWSQDVPDDGLYNTHASEVIIPAVNKGFYVLIASTTADMNANSDFEYVPLFFSNLSLTSRTASGDGVFEATVLDRNTGKPIKNADVTLYTRKYNSTAQGTVKTTVTTLKSNELGQVKYTSNKTGHENFYAEVKFENDFIIDESYFNIYRWNQNNEESVRTFFFTDRSIYRPGQTVYFKGIRIKKIDNKNSLVTNTTTTVYFYDANGQKISDISLPINEYGSFQGSFVIPQGLVTGSYRLNDGKGVQTIQVEEYKRPKFEVTVTKPKEVIRVNDKVTVKGNAKALAGFNITNAKVQYRVYRTSSFPFWFDYRYPVDREEQEIAYGKTVTDENGEFIIQFTAIPDKKIAESDDPTFTYKISVEVTDDAGETKTAEETVSIGYKTVNVTASIPDLINGSEIKPWPISVTNLNGQKQNNSVTVKVEKLDVPNVIYRSKLWDKPDLFLINEAEYKAKFPTDYYKRGPSPLLLPTAELVCNVLYDTKDTAGFIAPIRNLKPGYYRTIITTKDSFNKEAKSIYFFTVFNKKENKPAAPSILTANLLNDEVEPGSMAEFYLSSSKNIQVLYEVESNQKIIKSEFISLNNEQRILSLPISEEYRGSVYISFRAIYEGRVYEKQVTVTVPYTNKKLKIKLETYRDKMLPGSKEEWTINVSPIQGEYQTSELLLSMYDASLDAFVSNNWFFDVWQHKAKKYGWNTSLNNLVYSIQLSQVELPEVSADTHDYEQLNWFGLPMNAYLTYYWERGYREKSVADFSSGRGDAIYTLRGAASPAMDEMANQQSNGTVVKEEEKSGDFRKNKEQSAEVKIRSNFNETVFFYPQLKTDAKGNAAFSFTMPESLTKWKFMALAHTKSLQVGTFTKEVVTQKELMINTFSPRFLREGDELFFTAKITNLTQKEMVGKATLELKDPITDANIGSEFGLTYVEIPFSVKPGQSVPAEWKIKIPFKRNLVKYSVKAISSEFSDGEENVLPILTNRMLVTETLPIWMNGKENKDFDLTRLTQGTPTRQNLKLSIEFTANPAWYAIQALPYLMEYPYECAEQTFSRLYANSIATHIANSDPKIKAVFDTWKNYQPNALQSKLEQNQDLKNVLLEETPWVREAKNESERKRRVGILFDLNRMKNERASALKKLADMQLSDGSFPWFKGGFGDRYITQYIITGFGKMSKLGIEEYNSTNAVLVKNAVAYLDMQIANDYKDLVKNKANLDSDNLSYVIIHYLYARSFFKTIPINDSNKEAAAYFLGQAEKYWMNKDDYSMGMIALAMHRADKKSAAQKIIASLKDRSIHNEELGMYWKGMLQGGYYWYNSPIETMALLIEAFDEVTPADVKSVDDMRKWLLKNKQTNDWKTTKATADASYALLLKGTNILTTNNDVNIHFTNMSGGLLAVSTDKAEAGTGYLKSDITGNDIATGMRSVSISKKSEGLGWGSVYWQYLEDIDKITKPSTPNPMVVSKKIFREVKTDKGLVLEEVTNQTKLEPGDRIISRIILVSDRPMEYVHLKDMRASGLEPENVLSTYKYQQGLGYYESTRDVATHFFISYVPRGTYVFEYPSRVTHKGNFSNGITQVQCMYAPEFTFHSEGIRVNIK